MRHALVPVSFVRGLLPPSELVPFFDSVIAFRSPCTVRRGARYGRFAPDGFWRFIYLKNT